MLCHAIGYLAHDRRAVVVVREVDAHIGVERAFEADALGLAAKVSAVTNGLGGTGAAARRAIAARQVSVRVGAMASRGGRREARDI